MRFIGVIMHWWVMTTAGLVLCAWVLAQVTDLSQWVERENTDECS